MYLSRTFIARNKVNVAIVIFIILFSAFHYLKPGFAYNREGGYRPFGLGFKNKTVIPIWIISIIFAILSYLVVLFSIR
jgi:hypothetical protein